MLYKPVGVIPGVIEGVIEGVAFDGVSSQRDLRLEAGVDESIMLSSIPRSAFGVSIQPEL